MAGPSLTVMNDAQNTLGREMHTYLIARLVHHGLSLSDGLSTLVLVESLVKNHIEAVMRQANQQAIQVPNAAQTRRMQLDGDNGDGA